MESSETKGLPDLHHANPLQHGHCISQTHKHNPISSLLNMQPDEVEEHQAPTLPNPSQNLDRLPFSFSRFFTDPRTRARLREFSSNTSPLSDENASNGVKELQQCTTNERRLKRMISNRESARRSRMRKKKHIEELQYEVQQVQTANQQLSEKLIQLFDCNQQILQENAQLKGKVSSLQIVLADLLAPLRNVEVTCNANRASDETPARSTTSLFH